MEPAENSQRQRLLDTELRQAGPALLASYQQEHRPNAEHNTGYVRRFVESFGLFVPVAEIEQNSPEGTSGRRIAGEYLVAHGRAEFDVPGITVGAPYYNLPIIVGDGKGPPPGAANLYVPSPCPGGRALHLWLSSEQSLYDTPGFEWALLRLSRGADCQTRPRPPETPSSTASARCCST